MPGNTDFSRKRKEKGEKKEKKVRKKEIEDAAAAVLTTWTSSFNIYEK